MSTEYKIDLNKEINDQFRRCRDLAQEAEHPDESDASLPERASALRPLSSMLTELTKAQETIVNMKRLAQIERAVTETVKECLSPNQYEVFLANLELRLRDLE